MNKLISRTVSLAMAIVMTGSISVLGAEMTAEQKAAATPVTETAPEAEVNTAEKENSTAQNMGKKLVPKQLESKAQPSLFAEPPKAEPIPAPVKPAVATVKYDFDIASYTTKYTGAETLNRNFNMRLASDSVNGVILQPGQEFSFNDIILAKSNKGKQYKEAGVYVNGELSTGIGGGICQISSTLYQAALYSGMEITRRQNHSLKVGYMAAGRDATASWGSIDFKFKNALKTPVKIESVMQNGKLKVRFLTTQDPKIGAITVNVTQNDGVYTLTRTRADGTIDHTSKSKYKD